MFLIFGLGNVDLKYQNTRHNFGFLLADKIIDCFDLQFQGIKFGGKVFVGSIIGKKVILIKPQEYMNNSGTSVFAATQFYKTLPNQIIVLHDDLDLAFGKIKVKVGGGNGGHNGLKDIDAKVGQDYFRLRLGIGRPKHVDYEISDYVLSKFSREELEEVEKINTKICKNFSLILEGKFPEFTNAFYL